MAGVAKSNRGPKSLTCLPCAKRKVRCDRSFPCSNCKRRKESICVYANDPDSDSIPTGGPTPQLDKKSKVYVSKLEDYIRQLGGDPEKISQPPSQPRRREHELGKDEGAVLSSDHTSSRIKDGLRSSNPTGADRAAPKGPTLINHGDHSIYIESPMWFSFNDVTRSDAEAKDDQSKGSEEKQRTRDSSSGFNPFTAMNHKELLETHPPPEVIWELWQKFLHNVHPLVKIFFAWEIETLVQKGTESTRNLTDVEQCLLFSIYFITCLSLSESEVSSFLKETKINALHKFQTQSETSLQAVGVVGTTSRPVLQAFILYLLAMRNRGNPSSNYALMGIAVRIAERLGLQRDGAILKLSPYETELRRRIWWQMMLLDIYMATLTGCLPLNLYAPWDTHLPTNLEDEDIQLDLETFPQERAGLTSMSACLCSYSILHIQRSERSTNESSQGATILDPDMSLAEKGRKIDSMEAQIREKFLQYCQPIDPLQMYMQIIARSVILAGRRVTHQPKIANAKVSDMTRQERDALLQTCIKALEYNILGATMEAIKHFAWHNAFYVQYVAFVYVIIETYHRHKEPQTQELWALIERMCEAFPWLTTEMHRIEVRSAARLILSSWDLYQEQFRQWSVEHPQKFNQLAVPQFISRLQMNLAKEKLEQEKMMNSEQPAVVPQTLEDYPMTMENYDMTIDGDYFWDLSYWEGLLFQ